MQTQDTVWERKPHTAAKHSILQRYLEAWFPKLSWTGRLLFVDGFAGPGEYLGGEPGSPLIALQVAGNHKGDLSECDLVFIFVERDPDRFRHLQTLIKQTELPKNIRWYAQLGEFSDEITGILDGVEKQGKQLATAFYMIDPFGFSGVPFELIARAAKHPRSEFLISLMYESIARWRRHPDHEATFDSLFGCKEWREADNCATARERKAFLVELYASQLLAAGLDYVRTFEMLDEGNRTEYFLVFATHSIHGLRAMKAAMWKVAPSGAFQFSDATNPNQMTLFDLEPDYDQLRRLMIDRFAKCEVTVEEIERFVLADTSFRETHYKRQVLAELEKGKQLEVVKSSRTRSRTYPAGTVIRFL